MRETEGRGRRGRKKDRDTTPTRKINYVISESRDSPTGLRRAFYWSPLTKKGIYRSKNITPARYEAAKTADERGKGKEKEGTPIFRFDGGICGEGGESGVRAIFRFVRLRCLAAITRAGNYDFVVISGRTDDERERSGRREKEKEREKTLFSHRASRLFRVPRVP